MMEKVDIMHKNLLDDANQTREFLFDSIHSLYNNCLDEIAGLEKRVKQKLELAVNKFWEIHHKRTAELRDLTTNFCRRKAERNEALGKRIDALTVLAYDMAARTNRLAENSDNKQPK
jgi:hypothetical protein